MSARTVQLEEVATVFNGKTPSKSEQRRSGHPVLKIKDVDETGRFIGRFDSFVDFGLAESLSRKIVRDGDTLILNAAHNAAYVASKSFFAHGSAVGALATGEWLVLRPVAEHADARFIYYWSQHSRTRRKLGELVKGIHLYPKDVAQLPIPLPDLSEQKRIARLLEQADRLRRTRRYALELSDTFLPAAFLELFGDHQSVVKKYSMKLLQEVVQQDRGVTYGIVQAGQHIADGIPYIKTGDIVDGVICANDLSRTSQEIADGYKRSEVKFGDLVMSIRATVGTIAVLPKELEGANLTQGTARIAPGSEVEKLFLLWQIRMPETQRWISQQVKGSTFFEITLARLREMPVFVPPLFRQQQFAALVERHERLRASKCEALRQADHLFLSLLDRTFSRDDQSLGALAAPISFRQT